MDIFKLIHKIRNLSPDDKLNIIKKIIIIILIGATIMTLTLAGFNVIKRIFNDKEVDKSTVTNLNEEYEDENTSEFTPSKKENKEMYEKPTATQESDFNKYNCLEISEFNQSNGEISFKAKNTGDFDMENISVDLYNNNNERVTTLNISQKAKLKSGESILIEGFSTQEVFIKTYSFMSKSLFVTVNINNRSALTEKNTTPSL